MQNKLCLVTGATDGIGKAAARALLQAGATVIVHGRDPVKTEQVAKELRGSGKLHTVLADFSSLDAVRGMAVEVQERYGRLDVLINNAGVLTDHRQLSCDGFELTFAVNYLAPYLLTNLLLQHRGIGPSARIVNVASSAMGGGAIQFDDLQAEKSFSGWQAYANSKLANVLFSNVLAERLADEFSALAAVSNSLCPGLIDSNFFHTNTVFADGAYERMQPGMRTPEEGAAIPVYLAIQPQAGVSNGKFFMRQPGYFSATEFRPLDISWDREVAQHLWEHSHACVAPWLETDTTGQSDSPAST
jgi:NAD(P)-dependent dehydrogenase (short-subunit alcohol dehydrogenase family)